MDFKEKKVAIIGAGSWATALAKIVMTNVPHIYWYMRKQEQIDGFMATGRNPHYLTSERFDTSRITFTADINDAVASADVLILAIPSPFMKLHLKKLRRSLRRKYVISAIKGLVPDENIAISDYLHVRYQVPDEQIGVIAGPCHAEEAAMERLSYLTIGCTDRRTAKDMCALFENEYIHTTPSDDVLGLEYTSVMKNIYAIASGMCYGLKYGDNFQAVLVANAAREMDRFCNAINPIHRDIKESAYLGDLMVTAYSQFSRNRQFGHLIGRGYSVRSAQLEMEMIAEGYYGAKCIHEFNKRYSVMLPIAEAVYQILYHQVPPTTEIRRLNDNLK